MPPDSYAESVLPPLQRYGVREPVPVVRAESTAGTLLVDGDGFALPQLAAAGLADGRTPFRYLGDLGRGELADLLGPDRRLVLTDTNRRRTAVPGRLADGQGPLLAARDDTGPTRTLFGPRAQTVLRDHRGPGAREQRRQRLRLARRGRSRQRVRRRPAHLLAVRRLPVRAGRRGSPSPCRRPAGSGRVVLHQAALGTVSLDGVTVRAGGRRGDRQVPARPARRRSTSAASAPVGWWWRPVPSAARVSTGWVWPRSRWPASG